MFNLSNISVKDFFQLDEQGAIQYVELQSIMKSKPIFCKRKAKNFGYLQYGEVAQLKRFVLKPTFDNIYESFRIVFGVKKREYLNSDVTSFFYALNWIRECVVAIIEKEKSLQSEPEPELEMAGVKRLSVFGEMSVLINLGQKYGKSPTEIEKWKYNLVFTILMYDKVYGEIHKKYMEIKHLKRSGSKR